MGKHVGFHDRVSCQELCDVDAACQAVEVSGCARDATCLGVCTHYSNVKGALVPGSCDTDENGKALPAGDKKCWEKEVAQVMQGGFDEIGVGLHEGYFAVVYAKPTSPMPRTVWDDPHTNVKSKSQCGLASSDSPRQGGRKNPSAAARSRREDKHTRSPFETDLSVFQAPYGGHGITAKAKVIGATIILDLEEMTQRFFDPKGHWGGGGHRVEIQGHRWFAGSVAGYTGARANLRLRKNGGLKGTIRLPKAHNSSIVIEIDTDHNGDMHVSNLETHEAEDLAFKHDTDGEEHDRDHGHGHAGVKNNATGAVDQWPGPRTRRAGDQKKNTCGTYIDADKWFYDFWGGSGTTADRVEATILAMLDMMIEVQAIYVLNFRATNGPYVYVVGATVHISEGFGVLDPTAGNAASIHLRAYAGYLRKEATVRKRTAAAGGAPAHKGSEVCLNHLFTHVNFGSTVGQGFLGTNCKKSFMNSAFTSTNANNKLMSMAARQAITAHEIGHNFGAEHDCTPDASEACTDFLKLPGTPDIEDECLKFDDHFIMFPAVSSGENAVKFSPCSQHYMQKSFKDTPASCYIEEPENLLEYYAFPTQFKFNSTFPKMDKLNTTTPMPRYGRTMRSRGSSLDLCRASKNKNPNLFFCGGCCFLLVQTDLVLFRRELLLPCVDTTSTKTRGRLWASLTTWRRRPHTCSTSVHRLATARRASSSPGRASTLRRVSMWATTSARMWLPRPPRWRATSRS